MLVFYLKIDACIKKEQTEMGDVLSGEFEKRY